MLTRSPFETAREHFERKMLKLVVFTVAVLLRLFVVFLGSSAHAQDVALGPVAPVTTASGFLQAILPALLTALAGVVTAVIALLGRALHGWLTEKSKTSALAGAAVKLDAIAEAVVAHVNAGMRAKLEELSKDGEISADDAKALKAEGMRLLKEALGEEGLTSVAGALGIGASVVDTFLSGVLEKKVEAAKPAAAPAPAAPSPT